MQSIRLSKSFSPRKPRCILGPVKHLRWSFYVNLEINWRVKTNINEFFKIGCYLYKTVTFWPKYIDMLHFLASLIVRERNSNWLSNFSHPNWNFIRTFTHYKHFWCYRKCGSYSTWIVWLVKCQRSYCFKLKSFFKAQLGPKCYSFEGGIESPLKTERWFEWGVLWRDFSWKMDTKIWSEVV